jgi:hypothetical protein
MISSTLGRSRTPCFGCYRLPDRKTAEINHSCAEPAARSAADRGSIIRGDTIAVVIRSSKGSWANRPLDEVLADVRPITSWDDLAIPDLSDEEWEAFAAALKDD